MKIENKDSAYLDGGIVINWLVFLRSLGQSVVSILFGCFLGWLFGYFTEAALLMILLNAHELITGVTLLPERSRG